MKGSIPRKIGRLVADLVTHPQYVPRCVEHNLINGRSPLDLEIPWFSYAAIDFLDEFLGPDMIACEYGSGGSTIFYAQRTKFLYSIEDNQKWYELVTKRLLEKQIHNVELRFRPFDFKDPVGFENSEYLNAIPDGQFDVISIDGSEEWKQVRPTCFARAEKHIKPGGIIVVDDSWRYPVLRANNKAKRFRILQSVGPCRPGVTSTDVFFY
ncbi:MAG: class I SAM-dependent methyltransferase [Verrucomicrobia subdivision 3 bacterium]|nr:class I SAM-dependent methyltransferase [Limisphaerales bacterium]